MVIFTGWCLPPVFPRSTCSLPMAGEDTGLEAVASPMAGYLGKVQERAASLDSCPWCRRKGVTYPLRSYRINLEESITLCTNPQCLFPLVSRPLEEVLSSLVPVELASENKRKSPLAEAQQQSPPSPKRVRLYNLDDSKSPTIAPRDVHNKVNNCNGQSTEPQREIIKGFIDGLNSKLFEEKDNIYKDLNPVACTEAQNFPITLDTGEQDSLKSLTDNQQVLSSQEDRLNDDNSYVSSVELDKSCSFPDGGVFTNENKLPEQTDTGGTTMPILQTKNASFVEVFESERDTLCTETDSEELVAAPTEIFWRNENNLCWLNSLLVALVNLKSLRKSKPEVDPEQCPMWTVLTGYNDACAAIQSHQQPDEDGCLKIPNHVLHKLDRDLETRRMSIFNILQPTLHCKLGQNDTPVFALPLLVKMDPWLETLFETTFYWEFKCTKCKRSSKQNVVKTLPTFTNIVPDWHPLRAVHFGPCNSCHWKNQRRKMVLQKVPPVFALHFVEGLPDNNIQVYSFTINNKHYSVSAIIQYSSQHKHFVTWVHRSDGSWVELDDLKHPHCKSFKTLLVPAQEIHIVFWEEEDKPRQESRACSPSTTFTEYDTKNDITHSLTDLDVCSPDQSPLDRQRDSDVMDAMLELETTKPAGVDTSIGSTTLLETFEGLTHNDIVTLTLVEMKGDGNNPNDIQDLKDVIHKVMEDTPAPDSSSTIEAKDNPTKTDIDSSSVSEPKSKRGQKKGRAAAGKKAKTTKVDNSTRKIASEVTKNTSSCLVKSKSPRASTKPSSPVSSSISTTQNVTNNVPQAPPVNEQQQKGWSLLLSRSLGHIQNTTCQLNSPQKPVTQVPAGPVHSTPRQKTKAVPPKAVPKPVLRTEEEGGLPLKAAEMYGAFGSKNSKSDNTLCLNKTDSPFHKHLSCNAMLNNSNNTSKVGLASDTLSVKTKLSKLPPGLNETEALRYKLLKKLKAKKKKLAKLNGMLGQMGEGSFKPDSTNMSSPNTVTSSTLDEEFFSDLLSPATTITSTLSPDSTDLLEMLANGQEATIAEDVPSNPVVQQSSVADTAEFLDEFMSQAIAERPTEMEAEALSALELFL